MRPPEPPPDQYADLAFPAHGLDVMAGFHAQRPLTTPSGTNVRTYEPTTLRARGGSRPGLAKYLGQQLPPGAAVVQHLNVVVDPQGSATFDAFDPTLLDLSPLDFQGAGGVFLPPPFSPPGLPWPGHLVAPGGTGEQPYRGAAEGVLLFWADPVTIPAGGQLGPAQLSALAYGLKDVDPVTRQPRPGAQPVPGTYAYSPGTGAVMRQADDGRTLLVIFTPLDTTAYKEAAKHTHLAIAQASWAFVQGVTDAAYQTGSTSWSLSTAAPVTAGGLIVVAWQSVNNDNPNNPVTFADSQGNAYRQAGATQESTDPAAQYANGMVSLWYAVAAAAGPLTVTFTQSEAGPGLAGAVGAVLEYAGNAAGNPLDQSGAAVDDTAGATSLSLTVPVSNGVVAPGDLAVAVFSVAPLAAPLPSAGWAVRALTPSATGGLLAVDRAGLTADATVTVSPTLAAPLPNPSGLAGVGASFFGG